MKKGVSSADQHIWRIFTNEIKILQCQINTVKHLIGLKWTLLFFVKLQFLFKYDTDTSPVFPFNKTKNNSSTLIVKAHKMQTTSVISYGSLMYNTRARLQLLIIKNKKCTWSNRSPNLFPGLVPKYWTLQVEQELLFKRHFIFINKRPNLKNLSRGSNMINST